MFHNTVNAAAIAATTAIVALPHVSKDGTVKIYLRLIINREKKHYPTSKRVKAEDWDFSKHVLKSTATNFRSLIVTLNSYKDRADKVLNDLENQGEQITFPNFENRYLDNTQPNCFYAFANKQIEIMKKDKTHRPSTIRQTFYELEKLKGFKPKVYLNQIDKHFLQDYTNYMRDTLANKPVTIHKTLKKMRMLLYRAESAKLIPANPFRYFKLKVVRQEVDYLTMNELARLEYVYHNIDMPFEVKNVLRIFLYCCYTGLRWSDVYALSWNLVYEDHLDLTTIKCNTRALIPLSNRAKSMMPERPEQLLDDEGKPVLQKVFKVLTNQKCNMYLKVIGFLAGLSKTLKFHMARHTFATTMRNLGTSLDDIGDMLAHLDKRSTAPYARLELETKKQEVQKWDNVFDSKVDKTQIENYLCRA